MLRAFSWVVLANLARQASFLIVNVVLFERLTRSTFGALALAFGYMSVFAGLGEFGIRPIGWREVARRPSRVRSLAGRFLAARSATATVSLAAYLLLMPLLWEPGLPPAIYLAYGLGILVNGTTFDFPLYGLGRIDLYARYCLVAFLLYLAGCLLLVTDDSRAWLVPVLFAGSMVLLLLMELRWLVTRHGGVRLRLRVLDLGRILRESWHLGVGETLHRLTLTYPLILIGMVVGSEGVGDYRIAELAYSFLAQFGHMFAAAGFSRLSHLYAHERDALPAALRRMVGATLAAAVVAGGVLAAFAPAAFRLAFEGVADETLVVLPIMGLALAFAAPARLMKALLPSIDRQRSLLVVNSLALSVGVGLGLTGSLTYGIVGMAASIVVTELVTLGLLLFVYSRSLALDADG